ncbi:MAG TPA: hypothetical protein VEB86_08040 [Chryseosolibacter sp.]|nr:hypothetical protein [Chryseosolibacter sp.]
MVLKLFKGLWFVSVLIVLANLLYVYASLPEEVVIQQEGVDRVLANRELLFYVMTLLLVLTNALVYVMRKFHEQDQNFRAWFHGLIITMNIFFVLGMNVIQVYNSAEKFDFSRIGFIVYASVALVICWAATWPIYSIFRRLVAKQVIS